MERQLENVEAEASFIQALAMCENLGYELGRANALRGIGHARQARSEYVEAEMPYTQALSIYGNIGNERGRENATLGLSRIRFCQVRYVESRMLINGIMGASERINYGWAMKKSKRLLEEILEAEIQSVEP